MFQRSSRQTRICQPVIWALVSKAAGSKNKEYYSKILDVIRGIMSISLKTNEYLKFAIVTGCLRISKESIFTGVNNFACYGVSNRKFSQYFGFTEDEMAGAISRLKRKEKTIKNIVNFVCDGLKNKMISTYPELSGLSDVSESISL